MKQYFFFIVFMLVHASSFAQTEEQQVRATLMNYIEGTSYNYPEKIQAAFHDSSNLYLSKQDNDFWIVPSKEYISWFKNGETGKFNGRFGKILFVDISGDIALAKAEILYPQRNLGFIDAFILKKVAGEWKIISKTATRMDSNKTGKRILFVVSNAKFYGKTDLKTGNSFSEIVKAYKTFEKAGYWIDFMSPEGGAISMAYMNMSDPEHQSFLYNPDFMAAVNHTYKPSEVNSKDYKAVYYVGGGASMFGVPEDVEVQKVVMEIYEQHGGVISSVCHGTAGIVNLKTKDGNYLVAGKRVNGYPDDYENKEADYYKTFPFAIKQTIIARGGTFKQSPRNTPHLEIDGRLVTGQNHLSSALVAQKVIELLENVEKQ